MKWTEQFDKPNRKRKQTQENATGPIQISGISEIPFEATLQDTFRLTVDVEAIDERETKTGNPFYFLQCRDEDGMLLSVVCWQWHFQQLQVEEGKKLELDVRIPGKGYSAFTLA